LAGFGLAKKLENSETVSRTQKGSKLFKAPEALFDEETGDQMPSDMWSVGVIMYYLCMLEIPFKSTQAVISKLYYPPILNEKYSNKIKMLNK